MALSTRLASILAELGAIGQMADGMGSRLSTVTENVKVGQGAISEMRASLDQISMAAQEARAVLGDNKATAQEIAGQVSEFQEAFKDAQADSVALSASLSGVQKEGIQPMLAGLKSALEAAAKTSQEIGKMTADAILLEQRIGPPSKPLRQNSSWGAVDSQGATSRMAGLSDAPNSTGPQPASSGFFDTAGNRLAYDPLTGGMVIVPEISVDRINEQLKMLQRRT